MMTLGTLVLTRNPVRALTVMLAWFLSVAFIGFAGLGA